MNMKLRDIARMMAEQVKAGAAVGLPSNHDEDGYPLWKFEWPPAGSDRDDGGASEPTEQR